MTSPNAAPGIAHRFFTPFVSVIVLVLAGLALRLFRLDHQSLWYDESFAVVLGFAPLGSMLQQLIADFVHPPLHYLMLQAIDLVSDLNSFSARALSVCFGVLTIPFAYLAGKALYNPRCGLVTAMLCTLSQLGVMYSQEARPYALQIFCIVLLLYFFALALKRHYWAWWCAVLAAVLAVYTQYYSVFVILPLACWALWRHRQIGLHRIFFAALIAIVLYLPWLLSGIIDSALSAEKTTGDQPGYFSISWETFFDVLNRYNNGGFENVLSGGPRWLFFTGALLFTAPAVLAIARALRPGRLTATLGWLAGTLVIVGLSLAYGGSKAGLVLAVLYALRAAVVGMESSPFAESAVYRLASNSLTWILTLLAAFIVCLIQNVYEWVFFMLGLMLGCIALQFAVEKASTADDKSDRSQDLFLLLAVLMGIGAPIMLGVVGMQFDTRYTLSALPVYYLLVAAGVAQIQPRMLRRIVLAAICVYSLVALRANYFSPYKENWRDSLALVIDAWQDGDCVTMTPDTATLPNAWFAYGYEQRLPDVHYVAATDILAASSHCQRIWFLQYGRVNSTIEAAKALQREINHVLQPQQTWHYHWIEVMLYAAPQT